MPFIPVPGVVQVEIRQTLHGQRIENVFYVDVGTEVPTSSLENITELMGDWWEALVLPNLSNNIALREVYGTDLSSASGGTHTRTYTTPVPGSVVGESLPANCALCVSLRTAQRGRSFRGRSYVAGIPEEASANSVVSNVVAAPLLAAYQTLITSGDYTERFPLVVVSRVADGAPRVTGVATPIVTAVLTNQVISSQRRRLPGRGE